MHPHRTHWCREDRPDHEPHAHPHRRHGGPFGGPFGMGGGPFGMGGGPFGPGPRGRGRRRRGDVRTALLLLLAEGQNNGYGLMREIEQRSDGRWSPSPGAVYPALAQLEDEGLIRATRNESDPGNVYEITDAGRAQLAERGEQRAPWEPEGEEADDARHALRHALKSTAAAAWQVAQAGDETQVARATALLEETRRRMYRLLAGDAEDDA